MKSKETLREAVVLLDREERRRFDAAMASEETVTHPTGPVALATMGFVDPGRKRKNLILGGGRDVDLGLRSWGQMGIPGVPCYAALYLTFLGLHQAVSA